MIGPYCSISNRRPVGYNDVDVLSGGFVYGIGGSGIITPRIGGTPAQSGANTPGRAANPSQLSQLSINNAFNHNPIQESVKITNS